MAQVIAKRRGAGTDWFDAVRGFVDAAVQRIADRRAYHQTVRELSALGAHELADLGLHRGEIRSVAYATVYGARR